MSEKVKEVVFGFKIRWNCATADEAVRLGEYLTGNKVICSVAGESVIVPFGITQIGTAMRLGPPENIKEILKDAAAAFEKWGGVVDFLPKPALLAYVCLGSDFGSLEVGRFHDNYAYYRRGYFPEET